MSVRGNQRQAETRCYASPETDIRRANAAVSVTEPVSQPTFQREAGSRDDPPVRPDGKCAVCPKPRHPERSSRYARGHAEADSFCSSECCRKWHGCELSPHSIWGAGISTVGSGRKRAAA